MKKNIIKKIFSFFHLKYVSYNFAFILSLFLTCIPFFLVQKHVFNSEFLYYIIFFCCIIQVFVHMIFFLHIKKIHDKFLNLFFLIFTILIMLIIIIGSIWIMWNLNHYEKIH